MKAVPIDRSGPPACSPTFHRHEPPPSGGRCAYYSPGRPGDICGRTPTAVYISPTAKVHSTYRCRTHDREVNRMEAERQGFRRLPVGDEALTLGRLARRGDCEQ